MNIWIINHDAIPPSMGGLVRHYYFSKYLQEKAHEVKIFTASTIHNAGINMIKGNEKILEKEVDGIEYTFIKTRDYKGNGIDRIFNIFEFALKIRRLGKYFEKPDVIYTSSPDIFTAYSALKLAKRLKVKVVLEVRDIWPESIVLYNKLSNRNPIIALLYKLEKYLYVKADKIIFTMEGGKDYIIENSLSKAVDISKVHHVNNGVDLEEFEYNKIHYNIDDNDLLDDSLFKIVYTGSIRKVNNLEVIINTAQILKNRSKNKIKFLIYGEGTEKNELENFCKENNIDNVVFKGRVEKKFIPFILTKSNLNIVHVKSTELNKYGYSWNKIFEYFASGVPVLSDYPAKYDLIEKYNLGMVVKSQEPEDIAAAIIKFYEMQPEDYDDYKKRELEIIEKYDYKSLTKDILEILE